MSDNDEAPIEIAPYDSTWPLGFETERQALAVVLEPWLAGSIEHFGSTAVVGLPAKPVIDIMAAVRDLEGSRPAIDAVRELQYVHFPYRPDAMHWFCKPSPAHRTHHLHLVPFGSRLWIERLVFRDYLREHADVAAEYAALKSQLAVTFRFDREGYTDAKGPFIERVLAIVQCGRGSPSYPRTVS
jgi:GrpB-like predicted nucleotidyltransferase (UPF0157 family)